VSDLYDAELGNERQFLEWTANYSRRGYVSIAIDNCENCHQEKPCLYSDGSEGEYGGVYLCLDCIQSFFKTWDEELPTAESEMP
jgi:hypothetical protein